MKLIIGIYDRILSNKLAIVLSSKKILSIEAESLEEIPQLLNLHPGAMVLCEETSPKFYQELKKSGNNPDIYLIFHPNVDKSSIFSLRNMGIKALLPYSENPYELAERLIQQLSRLAQTMKKAEHSFQSPSRSSRDVTIHLPELNKWFYGMLQGFNSSKVSIKIDRANSQFDLLEHYQANNIVIYLQNLKVKCIADLVNVKDNNYIFRYRSMSKEDAERLAYYINYCQQHNLVKV